MKILFNPFEKYTEARLIVLGVSSAIAGSLLAAVFNARFDGVLDLHFVPAVRVYQPFLDNLVNIVSASLLLFLAAFAQNRKTRMVDILATVVIARMPLYILTVFNAGNILSDTSEKLLQQIGKDPLQLPEEVNLGLITVFGLVSLLFIVWQFALLFNGYRVAGNTRGPMSVVLFILAVLLAEVLSKQMVIFYSHG
jgi:hypothetical protein